MEQRQIIQKLRAGGIMSFTTRMILFIILAYVFDLMIGGVLQHYYFKINHEENYRTTYALEQAREQVLIFGSSRANHHYDPRLIGDSLHASCFNAGRDGNFIFYQYAMLQSVLKRYHPEIIILDLCNEDLNLDPSSYDRLSSLLPYYRSHPEIRSIVNQKSRYERIKLLSHIYPYNSTLIRIVTGNLDFHGKRELEKVNKGFKAVDKTWNEPARPFEDDRFDSIDINKVKTLKLFIDDCKRADIALYIFVSPYYVTCNLERNFVRVLKSVTRETNIPFRDYSGCPVFISRPGYFADVNHLNIAGAGVYTNMVIKDILQWRAKGIQKLPNQVLTH